MSEQFDQWAIVELMGHVKIAGRVTEEERFGAKLGRVDIPAGEGFVTQYFNGSSLYRLTPVSEEVARIVAARNEAAPVYSWELPKQKQIEAGDDPCAEEPDDNDENDEEEEPPW